MDGNTVIMAITLPIIMPMVNKAFFLCAIKVQFKQCHPFAQMHFGVRVSHAANRSDTKCLLFNN